MKTAIKRAGLIAMTAALLALPLLATDNVGRRRVATPPPPAPVYASNRSRLTLRQRYRIHPSRPEGHRVNSSPSAVTGSVVDISPTDSLDQPLDRLGKVTPGAISVSFILSAYDPATRQYTAYTTGA